MAKLKLCGITRKDDYLLAGELGIDYAGFVFVPGSPRLVSADLAGEIIGAAPNSPSPIPVGVFADQPVTEIRRICKEAGLQVVQLHGNEPLSFCRELEMEFWKAVTSADELRSYPEEVCSPVLLDASGIVRTGALLSRALAGQVASTGRKVILAGGLNEDNIEHFLEFKPWGVDFSSSVEFRPGLKDPDKLRCLVGRIRGYLNE